VFILAPFVAFAAAAAVAVSIDWSTSCQKARSARRRRDFTGNGRATEAVAAFDAQGCPHTL